MASSEKLEEISFTIYSKSNGNVMNSMLNGVTLTAINEEHSNNLSLATLIKLNFETSFDASYLHKASHCNNLRLSR